MLLWWGWAPGLEPAPVGLYPISQPEHMAISLWQECINAWLPGSTVGTERILKFQFYFTTWKHGVFAAAANERPESIDCLADEVRRHLKGFNWKNQESSPVWPEALRKKSPPFAEKRS
jgi:hypothetical protein